MFANCLELCVFYYDNNRIAYYSFNSAQIDIAQAKIASSAGGYFSDLKKIGIGDIPCLNYTSDLSITGCTYGADPNAPTATARYGNITYTYALGTGSNVSEFSANVPTNVGDYTVKAYVAGTSSYTEATAFTTFTIEKATLQVDPTEYNLYAGSIDVGSFVQSIGLVGKKGTDDVRVRLTSEMPTVARATPYELTVALVGEDAANYKLAENGNIIYVTITDKPLATFSTSPQPITGLVYNGSNKALITAGTSNDGETTYRLGADGEFNSDVPTAVDAGTYKVYYKITPNDPSQFAEAVGVVCNENQETDIEIAKLPVSVSWNEINLTYSGENLANSVVASFTNVDSDEVNLDVTFTKNGEPAQFINAGVYVATASASADVTKNYILNNTTKEYTISPQVVENPVIIQFEFTYTGEPITLLSLEPNSIYALTSDSDLLTQTEVGTYTIKLALPNANYIWATDDNNDGIIEFEFTIVDSIEPNTLLSGTELNEILSENNNLRRIVFDNANNPAYSEFIAELENEALNVSVVENGNVKLFMVENDYYISQDDDYFDTAYILSMSNQPIYANPDCREMFAYLNVLSIEFNNFDTRYVTTMGGFDPSTHEMNGMFAGCMYLANLDLSCFDTSNVTNMASMFMGCGASNHTFSVTFGENFDTSNVTDMSAMFSCAASTLDLSGFDTSKVTNMMGMFAEAVYLESLDLSNFNTSNVTNMNGMFIGCGASNQTFSVTFGENFDTSKVTDMGEMFAGCKARVLDLTSFDVSNVTNMASMFASSSVEIILVNDDWAVESETVSTNMFTNCYSLAGIYATGENSVDYNYFNYELDTDKTFAVIATSANGGYLTGISAISALNTMYAETLVDGRTLNAIFGQYGINDVVFGCIAEVEDEQNGEYVASRFENVEPIDVSCALNNDGRIKMFVVGNKAYILNIAGGEIVFNYDCSNMFIPSQVYDDEMGANHKNYFTNIEFHHIDTSNVGSMYSMFATELMGQLRGGNDAPYTPDEFILDLSEFDTSNVGSMAGMFYMSNASKIIFGPNFVTTNVYNMDRMFSGCSNITELDLTSFDKFNCEVTLMFFGAQNLSVIFVDPDVEINVSYEIGYGFQYVTSGCYHLNAFYYEDDNIHYINSFTDFAIASSSVNGIFTSIEAKGAFEENYETVIKPIWVTTLVNGTVFDDRINQLLIAEHAIEVDEYGYSVDDEPVSVNLVFGAKQTYVNNGTITNEDEGYDMSLAVDADGDIKAYYVDGTIYILHNNASGVIYAHEDCSSMFAASYRNYAWGNIDLTNLNTSKVTRMGYMFSECDVSKITWGDFDTRNVTSMYAMFRDVKGDRLDLSAIAHFDTSNVTDMGYMFRESGLCDIVLGNNFDTSSVIDMSYMFSNCKNITGLDLSSFTSANNLNVGYMFSGCENLYYVLVGSNWTNATSGAYVFRDCNSLAGYYKTTVGSEDQIGVCSFNSSNTNNLYAKIASTSQNGYFTSINDEFAVDYIVDNVVPTFSSRLLSGSNINALLDGATEVVFGRKADYSSEISGEGTNVTIVPNGKVKLYAIDSKFYILHDDAEGIITFNVNCSNMYSSLDVLKVVRFDNIEVVENSNLYSMFENCGKLQVIFAPSGFSFDSNNSSNMFYNCDLLRGYFVNDQNNIDSYPLDSSNVDSTYAKVAVAGDDGYGYFTSKAITLVDIEDYYEQVLEPMFTTTLQKGSVLNSEYFRENEHWDSIKFGNVSDFVGINLGEGQNVSLSENGKIKAYVVDNTMYIVHEDNDGVMYFNNNSGSMFYNVIVDSIEFNHVNTSNVTNMTNMFYNSYALTSLDVSSFDTSSVKYFNYMFDYCKELTNLNLGNFDTSSATSFMNMFLSCEKLSNLDLSSFNTSNATSFRQMFKGCSNLEYVKFGNEFDTQKITDIYSMFDGCSNLKFIMVPNTVEALAWKDNSSLNCTYAFRNCNNLFSFYKENDEWEYKKCSSGSYDRLNLDLYSNSIAGYLTDNTIDIQDMLDYYNNDLQELLLITLDKSKLTSSLFPSSVTELKVGTPVEFNLDLAGKALTNVSLANADGKVVFYKDGSIGYILSTDNQPVIFGICDELFYNRSYLTSITFGNVDTSNVISMRGMFRYCSNLTSINWGTHFTTANVKDMSYMFNGDSKLTNLDLTNLNTSNVTTFANMFNGCSLLQNVDLGTNFITSTCQDFSYMFSNCAGLTTLDLSNFNTSNVRTFASMFNGCSSLTSVDLNFDTSGATDLTKMFYNCSGLLTITLGENFVAPENVMLSDMFRGCSALQAIYVPKTTDWSSVTTTSNSSRMFTGCTNLKGYYLVTNSDTGLDDVNTRNYSSTTSNVNNSRAKVASDTVTGYFTSKEIKATIEAYLGR